MNTDILLQTLRSRVAVTDDEYAEYISLCEDKHFKKGDIIIRAGSIPRFSIFVLEGCIRTYYIGTDDTERTTYFAEEGYWTGDLDSMRNAAPTQQNFQAIEDTAVLTLTRDKWEYAYKRFSWIAEVHALGQQRRATKLAEHIGRILTDTPETNYLRLMKERPRLLQRAPLYYIASYLGITAETLSRIRKKISQS